MIVYCIKCLYPNTKPDLYFDEEGVCGACRNFEKRRKVDWDLRHKEFLDVIDRFRSKDRSNYDCVVPVSGGKDSTYQVIRLLENDLNPLCVTATTDSLTELGRRNIENIKHLGVDYMEVTANPVIRRKISKIGLTQIGDISWPEHAAIFTIPIRAACQNNIPLLIWGENPQNEYGGPAAVSEHNILSRRWLEEFGGLLGMRISDLVGQEGIEPHHLIPFTYPSDDVLQDAGITSVFLGHYFPWDGYGNALYSQAHGFESFANTVEGSIVNYENLDNYQTGIHDYFKFLKFGFGRATDLVNNHIRRGRLTRRDGLKLVKMHDGKFPWTYLGRPIEEILAEIDVSLDEFIAICDRFTTKRLFNLDNHGKPLKNPSGDLAKTNYDNEQ